MSLNSREAAKALRRAKAEVRLPRFWTPCASTTALPVLRSVAASGRALPVPALSLAPLVSWQAKSKRGTHHGPLPTADPNTVIEALVVAAGSDNEDEDLLAGKKKMTRQEAKLLRQQRAQSQNKRDKPRACA